MTISHNLKDPHPKALEPDCLSPFLAIATQSPRAGLTGHLPVRLSTLQDKAAHSPAFQPRLYTFNPYSLLRKRITALI